MKFFKILFILILILVLGYAIFVGVDCYRIYNGKENTTPIITINNKEDDNTIIYTGVGYEVIYHISTYREDDKVIVNYNQAEFILFDRFMIWVKWFTK